MVHRILIAILFFAAGPGAMAEELVQFAPPMIHDRPLHYSTGLLSSRANRQTANRFCVLQGFESAESFAAVGYGRRGYTGEAVVIREEGKELFGIAQDFMTTDLFAQIICRKGKL